MYLGHNASGEKLVISADDLLTHALVIGRTGAGKTGLLITLLEEIASEGVSAVVLDPKGDLSNLALSLVSNEDFKLWIGENPDEARLRHGDGLSEFDLGFEHVAWWRQAVDVNVYTPGDSSIRPVNAFPRFDIPKDRKLIAHDIKSVLAFVGEQRSMPAVSYLTEAVTNSISNETPLSVEDWPRILTDPPEEINKSFGGMKLDDFFPKRLRTALARALVVFQCESDQWLTGDSLDFHWMAKLAEKPQIVILSMRHLSETDRQFFSTMVFKKLIDFMMTSGASNHLRLVVGLDEARGFLPPHPSNPPTKGPMSTILAQGRAHGLGMIIGTQNPMDLDYKALSNVGTWFLGRLRARDCNRDLANELSSRDVEIEKILSLPQRRFILLDKNGADYLLSVRWCYNHLRGPLSQEELARIAKR
ncbi:MAG: DUF853 family protein [Nitrososphaera sp.]|nr:DUF853 family protein [Nitrososphaera sp.]